MFILGQFSHVFPRGKKQQNLHIKGRYSGLVERCLFLNLKTLLMRSWIILLNAYCDQIEGHLSKLITLHLKKQLM